MKSRSTVNCVLLSGLKGMAWRHPYQKEEVLWAYQGQMRTAKWHNWTFVPVGIEGVWSLDDTGGAERGYSSHLQGGLRAAGWGNSGVLRKRRKWEQPGFRGCFSKVHQNTASPFTSRSAVNINTLIVITVLSQSLGGKKTGGNEIYGRAVVNVIMQLSLGL